MRSIVIKGIQSNEFLSSTTLVEKIVKTFLKNKLAKIEKVTLLHGGKKAMIEVGEWMSTPQAIHFAEKLERGDREVRLIHSDDDWWIVQPNEIKDMNGNTLTIHEAMKEVVRIENGIREIKREAAFSDDIIDHLIMVNKLIEKKKDLERKLFAIKEKTKRDAPVPLLFKPSKVRRSFKTMRW